MSQINPQSDYFSNHLKELKWPYTLYHQPIEKEIEYHLKRWSQKSGNLIPQALNVGCGFFHSYPAWQNKAYWSACDLDHRCISQVKQQFPEIKAFICTEILDLKDQRFDFILAKEVIEHVLSPDVWLKSLLAALNPGGILLISTPNYGFSLLPLMEYTVLEVIARKQGFSRFHIHPTKFNLNRLKQLIKKNAPIDSSIEVKKISWGMVLVANVELK